MSEWASAPVKAELLSLGRLQLGLTAQRKLLAQLDRPCHFHLSLIMSQPTNTPAGGTGAEAQLIL